MQSLNAMAWRNLNDRRLRTFLSVLAVALGVATTISGSIIAESIRKAILTSDELRLIMGGLLSQLDPLMNFVGVVIMLVAGFLIFNAFAMSVTQRRQQIGALRALGMTRRQMMRLLVTEALLIGGAGTLIGAIAAPLLGGVIIALLRQFIGQLFVFDEATPTSISVVLALSLGIGMTLLAVLFPARRAMRISPLSALRSPDALGIARNPMRRAGVGLLLIVMLADHLLISPPGEWVVFPADGTLAILFITLWLIALILILSRPQRVVAD